MRPISRIICIQSNLCGIGLNMSPLRSQVVVFSLFHSASRAISLWPSLLGKMLVTLLSRESELGKVRQLCVSGAVVAIGVSRVALR